MKAIVVMLLACLIPVASLAAGQPVEASMVVTGTVTVNTDGDVREYALHEQDKIPPGVVQMIGQAVKGWHFVPVVENGKPVTAQTGMVVRVVAHMVDKTHAEIRVTGASFGCSAYQTRTLLPTACPANTRVTAERQQPPRYPGEALKEGLGGKVYLAVDVGRDGRVIRAEATQVNLSNRIAGSAVRVQNVFAVNARDAAMKWRFNVPTVGPEAAKDHWVVVIPINYSIAGSTSGQPEVYGKWHAYVPGPARDVPWARDDASGSADAIAGDGTPFTRDARFVLKTQPGTAGDKS